MISNFTKIQAFESLMQEEFPVFSMTIDHEEAANEIMELLSLEHKTVISLITGVMDMLDDNPFIMEKIMRRSRSGNGSFMFPSILLYYYAINANYLVVLDNFELPSDMNPFLSSILEDLSIPVAQ